MIKQTLTLCYQFLRFSVDVIRDFNKQNCLVWSGGLAFTSLLAIVPVMVVGLYVLAMFPVFESVDNRIQEFILVNFVPSSEEIIKQYLNEFTQSARRLPDIGLVWLVVIVIFLIRTIEHVFNHIWGITTHRFNFRYKLWLWLRYWIVLTLTPIVLGGSVLLSTYLDSSRLFAHAWEDLSHNPLWVDYLPVSLATLFFMFLFRITPNTHVPWRNAFLSGLLSAFLLKWAKSLFTWSLIKFPTYQVIYGTMSIIPLFLLWIQLSWMIILLGAVFCRRLGFEEYSEDKIV